MSKILRSFVPASVQPVRLEKRADGQLPLITGYGAVFYRDGEPGTEYWLWDSFVERIAPGAFSRAINEDDVRALKNHDVNLLLGRTSAKTMRLSVDNIGLKYEIDPPDTQAGRDTVAEIQRGDLTGSSFSFSILEESWRKETNDSGTINIRTLNDVQVYDVGPVTFPAYSGTTTGVRCYRSASKHEAEEIHETIERMSRKVEIVTASMVEARCREIEIKTGLSRKRG